MNLYSSFYEHVFLHADRQILASEKSDEAILQGIFLC